MQSTLTNSQKWKQLFNILLPILVTQLALSAMTFLILICQDTFLLPIWLV